MELTHLAQREGRLSSFLQQELKMSTGLINRLKWQEKLLVNGNPQHTDFQVVPGDVIAVKLDAPTPDYPAEQGELTVLYEDDHLLAVEKPAGMLIHPSRSCNTGTLANRVLGYYEKTGQSCAFHPVTRLDRDTFGIVLLAKNSHIHSAMQQQEMKKTYHALVLGCPEKEEGSIDAPIARKPLPSLLREVNPEGKPSVTEYRVLERRGEVSVLALRPVTGRTHQLRVHCTYAGWPILGDPQYGREQTGILSGKMGWETQALCAKRLEFCHPVTEKTMVLESNMDVI